MNYFLGMGGDLLLLTLINYQNTSLLLLYFWQKSCSIDKSPLLSNEIEGGIYRHPYSLIFQRSLQLISLLNNFSRAAPALLLLSKGP